MGALADKTFNESQSYQHTSTNTECHIYVNIDDTAGRNLNSPLSSSHKQIRKLRPVRTKKKKETTVQEV